MERKHKKNKVPLEVAYFFALTHKHNLRSLGSYTRQSKCSREYTKHAILTEVNQFAKHFALHLKTAIWKAKSIGKIESRSKPWRRSTKKTITVKRALQWRSKVASKNPLARRALS